jgi:RNA polymerase sigma factor (sigma-70 family)
MIWEPTIRCRTLQGMSTSDADAWRRFLADEREGLVELFDLHEQRLYRHARRLLPTSEDAQDAVAMAFFELWRRRAAVRLVDDSPLPWLLTTVTNIARNLERSSRRYRGLLGRVEHEEQTGAAPALDETGVLAALRRLPERERSVIVLVVLEGYAERETAQALGIPSGTVKSRLARAKARLRSAMEGVDLA